MKCFILMNMILLIVSSLLSHGQPMQGLDQDESSLVVMEDFLTASGSCGEVVFIAGGVYLSTPEVTSLEFFSPPQSASFAFDTGGRDATEGIVEIYTEHCSIPEGVTAFSWRCKAPAGFTYTLAVENTGSWEKHVSPRFTQVLDQEWQHYMMNVAMFSPALPEERTVANLYITVFGVQEGGLMGQNGVVYWDDLVFHVPDLSGQFDDSIRMLGVHKGFPVKAP